MKETSQVTACVLDHGLFPSLAVELAKSFKRVLYQNLAAVDAFPTLNKCIIGEGYEGVEVIQLPEDHWDFKNEIDLYIYPDLYHGGEQRELESQGKAVWGTRHGDRLEVFRGRFLKALEEAGLEVAPHAVVHGLDELRSYLMENEDQYVKISRYRGTMETFHWRDAAHDAGWLDFMAVKLGAAKEMIVFYVFAAIDTDIEIGGDTYCIDYQYPSTMLAGYEWKDKGYFGSVLPAHEMPEQLQTVHEAFRSELAGHRYRNFISSEIRIKGDKFWFIDTTRRAPCPGSGSQLKLIKNFADVIWNGAHGILVEPEWNAHFATECVITAKADKTCWTIIDFPEELGDWVVCGGSCQIDGRTCWPPDESHGEEVGWLVNIADNPKAAIQGMLDKAACLPDGVSAATDSLADLLKEIESGQEEGVPFTDKAIPPPATVIENA